MWDVTKFIKEIVAHIAWLCEANISNDDISILGSMNSFKESKYLDWFSPHFAAK